MTVSIKTSKLRALWLILLGAQANHSDAFIFAKVGLTINHLATFSKDHGIRDHLFLLSEKAGELDPESQEADKIKAKIPSFKPIQAYICRFASKDDFGSPSFSQKVKKKGDQTICDITSGICEYPPDALNKYELAGIGKPSSSKHFCASCGSLRWNKDQWEKMVESL